MEAQVQLLDILKGHMPKAKKGKVISADKLKLTCLNLRAVADGVREAFLWDTTGSLDSPDKARRVCTMMDEQCHCHTKNHFYSIVVGGDYLFCKLEAVREAMEVWVRDRALIDIGGRIPKMVPTEEAQLIMDKIKLVLLAALNDQDDKIASVTAQDINLTTLVGLLLGYPVVYYWNINEEQSGGGCLDGCQLEVTSVWSGGVTLFQFSCPLELKAEVADKVIVWRTKLDEFANVEVRSEVVSQVGKLAM